MFWRRVCGEKCSTFSLFISSNIYQESVCKLPRLLFYLIGLSNLQQCNNNKKVVEHKVSLVEILENISLLAICPNGYRHGRGIIESGWICGVLGWGKDNPKLCLIARVKMAPIVRVALVFIKAVWRGIGLSIRALHTLYCEVLQWIWANIGRLVITWSDCLLCDCP